MKMLSIALASDFIVKVGRREEEMEVLAYQFSFWQDSKKEHKLYLC